MTKEKVAVYIGRFQPFHNGHSATLAHAFKNYRHVFVLLGSVDEPRTVKNPFSAAEREEMIQAAVYTMKQQYPETSFDLLGVPDYPYDNNHWLMKIQEAVESGVVRLGLRMQDVEIVLVGMDKDDSSAYLHYFPTWSKDLKHKGKLTLNATDIRNVWLGADYADVTDETKMREMFAQDLPDGTLQFLLNFAKREQGKAFLYLQNEWQFLQKYKKSFEGIPYADKLAFWTGDAVTVCAGHVLLIKRKFQPGKDLWALPGGYMDAGKDKSLTDTAIRELKEETRIKLSEDSLRAHIAESKEFGDFGRSLRWRIITRAVHIQLPDRKLPNIKGSDDAADARWFPLSEVKKMRSVMFEDHFHILLSMLGL